MNLKKIFKKDDELYTPKILVEPIIQYIPKNFTVWCPFDTDTSEFVLCLREKGYKVIATHIWQGQDFFNYEPEEYDCIISNPPFSIKLQVFDRLFKLNKPFAILMNATAEQYQVVGNFFYNKQQEGKHIQRLVPDKKVSFNGSTSSFNTCYFCYNLLPRDNMYCHLENNNSGKYFIPSRMKGVD